MNLACEILASFLLIFTVPTKGEDPESIVVWGALDHDLNLDIPGFPRSDIVADIKWNRNKNKIARIKKDMPLHNETDKYDMFTNGTLKIKTLMRNDSGLYEVEVYDSNGVNLLSKKFDLKIQEMLSGPEINWICTNRTVSCKVENGSNPKLELFLNMTRVKQDHGKLITYTWNTRWNKTFKCVASNHVDSKVSIEIAVCPDEGLDWYLIIGICVGGAVFLLFVALLIFYISRRKKQSRRRDDEELEIKAQRAILEERGRKPQQTPVSTPANPGMSQTPPVPGHRSQPPAHRPRALGPRVQPQQKRLPPTPGTQVHQQKGPPLPKPRVQTKPPCDAEENS
ncbi:T-cell surface antigen CD2 [Bos mutus]|uniref:T-cell surface antigen CD2 n=1 Tax=Bos mutus TaxID=72004 RepID=UPI0003C017D0|nr:PREDICTED: T-cell surface antigen CD2 [Bos mutus]